MGGIFGNLFDLNRDGEMSGLECGMEFMFLGMLLDLEREKRREYEEENDVEE